MLWTHSLLFVKNVENAEAAPENCGRFPGAASWVSQRTPLPLVDSCTIVLEHTAVGAVATDDAILNINTPALRRTCCGRGFQGRKCRICPFGTCPYFLRR